jgi:hypothetical protein
MIDRDVARRLVAEEIGYVFYDAQEWLETRDFSYRVLGNAPIIVDRRDGSLHHTGRAHPVEHYIREYERSRAK